MQCKVRYIAVVCRLSVGLSICPSVTLGYRGHIGWAHSKVITRLISLSLRSSEPKHQQSSTRGTPQNSGPIGVGSLLSAGNLSCNTSEEGQDRTKVTIDDQ